MIKRMRTELDNRIKWNQMLTDEIKKKIILKKINNNKNIKNKIDTNIN